MSWITITLNAVQSEMVSITIRTFNEWVSIPEIQPQYPLINSLAIEVDRILPIGQKLTTKDVDNVVLFLYGYFSEKYPGYATLDQVKTAYFTALGDRIDDSNAIITIGVVFLVGIIAYSYFKKR